MRLSHIDRIRAIAVLCMVEVHTAAIIPPRGMSVGDPAAFVAAAFGGMAGLPGAARFPLGPKARGAGSVSSQRSPMRMICRASSMPGRICPEPMR